MIDPDVVAESDAKAWSHLFFIEFINRMGQGLEAGRTEDFPEILQTFLGNAQTGYHERRIGPRALAPILLLMRFGLFLIDFDIDQKLKRHVLIVICQAVQEEVLKDDAYVTDRACLAALDGVLYRPLMPVWKMLIEYCYTAYKEPLHRVVSGSNTWQSWENAIRDIWPLLYISKIAPTHRVEHGDRLVGANSADYGKTPGTYSNEIRLPQPFYTKLFGPAEIDIHKDEQKMMEEVFAHLNATLIMIRIQGDRYFEIERSTTIATALKDGPMAARQRLLRRHAHELAFPKFFLDRLMSELRTLPAQDRTAE